MKTIQCPGLPYLITVADEGGHRPGEIYVETEAGEYADPHLLRLLLAEEETGDDHLMAPPRRCTAIRARTAAAAITASQDVLAQVGAAIDSDPPLLLEKIRYARNGCPACGSPSVTVDQTLYHDGAPVRVTIAMPDPRRDALTIDAVAALRAAVAGTLRRRDDRFYIGRSVNQVPCAAITELVENQFIDPDADTGVRGGVGATDRGRYAYLKIRAHLRRVRIGDQEPLSDVYADLARTRRGVRTR